MTDIPLKYSPQVRDYIASLSPEVKKRIREELKKLSAGAGDTHALKPPLEGYSRLRIGAHRIIYKHLPPSSIECVFAGNRAGIYHVFNAPAELPKQKNEPKVRKKNK